MRSRLAGNCCNAAAARTGRRTSSPSQFGQMPCSRIVAQRAQKVHSNEQIQAWRESGGRSQLQHSQFGLISNIPGSCRIWLANSLLSGQIIAQRAGTGDCARRDRMMFNRIAHAVIASGRQFVTAGTALIPAGD